MKNLLLLLISFVFIVNLYSQSQIQWQRSYGGSNSDVANSIISTNDGGYIIAGYTHSSDVYVTGNHGSVDIWVMKIDYLGEIQWKKCYGGLNQEEASSIKQTSDGGYVLAGRTYSNNFDVSGNHGYYDFWVFKIDAFGNMMWQKCLGGANNDEAFDIIETSDKGYAVCGYTYSTSGGDVLGNHGLIDIWVAKLDSSGNFISQKCFGGSSADYANVIKQTPDGGYIIAGHTSSTDQQITNSFGGSDMLLIKIDMMGNIQWQKCYGGSVSEMLNTMEATSDGGYILGGSTFSNDGMVVGHHPEFDLQDGFVVKVDSAGSVEWTKCFGGSWSDAVFSIKELSDGYMVAARTESHDFDVIGNHGSLDSATFDIWLLRLEQNGNIRWSKCIGGSESENLGSLALSGNNDIVVAGTTFSNDGDVISNSGQGDFWIVSLKDANISGRVFFDENGNEIQDSTENGVSGHIVRLNPGPFYTVSGPDGRYFFSADTGNHIVKYIPQQYWYTTTASQYGLSIDSANHYIDSLHFGIKSRININDVSIKEISTAARANFQIRYWLMSKNEGTLNTSGTIHFDYDSLLSFITSNSIPSSHTGNSIEFDYSNLGPSVQSTIIIDFQMPGTQSMGDTIFSNTWITPFIPDSNISNNYDTLNHAISGSFDPNDKAVVPAGYGQQGYVLHGQKLTYTIRFQNTGTDTAFSIILRDTLDTDLDLETIIIEGFSHPVTWELHSGNEIQFRFANVLLPDSNVNEPESHGFIRYSILPKSGLTDNTPATNTAYIYFDYNPAVITNTTLNTYVTNIPMLSTVTKLVKAIVFPNPSSDYVYINLPDYTSKAEVYDSKGNKVQQIIPQTTVLTINASELPAGLYFVKIYTSKGIINSKFVKE